jgi:hypothetical protein
MITYNLIANDKTLAQSTAPIVWVESEMSWLVITDETRTHYCDPLRQMAVLETTEP